MNPNALAELAAGLESFEPMTETKAATGWRLCEGCAAVTQMGCAFCGRNLCRRCAPWHRDRQNHLGASSSAELHCPRPQCVAPVQTRRIQDKTASDYTYGRISRFSVETPGSIVRSLTGESTEPGGRGDAVD